MRKETLDEVHDTQANCSRPYQLGRRETAMEATRAKILTAARELMLGDAALPSFSMEAVARQAGITRMTVYGRFGSKRGLLESLFDEMGARGRLGERLPAAFARPDPLDALQAYIAAFCDFWDSDRVLNRRLRGYAAWDREFAEAIASRYQRRHQAIELLLSRLDENKIISLPADRKDLVQTLLALLGFEFYDVLAGERSPQEVAPILSRFVLAALEIDAISLERKEPSGNGGG